MIHSEKIVWSTESHFQHIRIYCLYKTVGIYLLLKYQVPTIIILIFTSHYWFIVDLILPSSLADNVVGLTVYNLSILTFLRSAIAQPVVIHKNSLHRKPRSFLFPKLIDFTNFIISYFFFFLTMHRILSILFLLSPNSYINIYQWH